MTDQRTLKKIISEQREAIAILENAVKLADEFKQKMRENWKVEVTEYEAKIEAANKILDENTPVFNEFGHNYNTWDVKDIDNFIGALRAALEIPRKEESGESGPDVGDGSDPKRCMSLPIIRRQPTSKTSLKNCEFQERKEV
jgi:hypothetical protein